MITTDDVTFLRRAIHIAATAITTGDDPYGSLLVGSLGEILIEAHNTVRRDNDITAHPELKLARWAARELDPDTAARTTMYTSCQPCGMCSGAILVLNGRACRATGLRCSTRHASPSTATTSRNPRPDPATKVIDPCCTCGYSASTEPNDHY